MGFTRIRESLNIRPSEIIKTMKNTDHEDVVAPNKAAVASADITYSELSRVRAPIGLLSGVAKTPPLRSWWG
jgi:DNA-binding transcriptional regulator PaaX